MIASVIFILLLLTAAGSATLLRALRRAPDGFEDRAGFHRGFQTVPGKGRG
jgi:hypothetical protein